MRFEALVGLFVLCGTGLVRAQSDRVVDPLGSPGTYPTIVAAMLASSPGDRVLVMPGTYGAFQFSRGVHLLGLGSTPSEVVIERIAFHVNIPNENYDTLIANLTVRSNDPINTLAIHGNELAPGTLTLDGCVLENGVYLRGGQQGFYVLINNCKILPPGGHGFAGEACWIGGPGNHVDIRNTRIVGWGADAASGVPAGIAVRVAGGTRLRIDGCELFGGQGAPGSVPVHRGADALVSIGPGTVDLRIDGASLVVGGDGIGGPGGHGASVTGSIELGHATVIGGSGNPSGQAWSLATPTPLATDPHLGLTPSLAFAEGAISLTPGQTITASVGNGSSPTLIAIAPSAALPDGPLFLPLPLASAVFMAGPSFTTVVPRTTGTNPGPTFYIQAAVLDPITETLLLSNIAAVRIDP